MGAAGRAARPQPPTSILRLCWDLAGPRKSRGADPLVELRRPDVIAALARLQPQGVEGAGPRHALRVAAVVELWPAPEHDIVALCRSLQKTARALSQSQIGFDLWPQLDDDNRYLNTRTARVFSERLLPVLKALGSPGALGLGDLELGLEMGVFLDMEPALSTVASAWTLRNGAPVLDKVRGLSRLVTGVVENVWDARQGLRDLQELARDIAGFSFAVTAAVPPPVLPLDSFGASAVKRFVLGCPDDDDDGASLFGRTAALCHAPLLRRRGADRAEQHRALSLWAARHRERSDAICLGPLSTGLLGDEPVYLAPEHLRQDLTAVRALGFRDVTLASAEGLLFADGEPDRGLREDVDAWIDAVVAGVGDAAPTTWAA